jgi:hypothetical protein
MLLTKQHVNPKMDMDYVYEEKIMKHFTIICLLMSLIVPVCFAEGTVVPEIFNPMSIKVDENQIYITQGVEIFIYSKKDIKLLTKFGKEGEGPREFKKSPLPWIPSVSVYLSDNNLMVNSLGRISFFSKKGEFISENQTGVDARFIPIGKKYIRMQYTVKEKLHVISADLMDANFKKEKNVCVYRFPAQEGKKRNPLLLVRMNSYFDRFVQDGNFVFPSDTNDIWIFNEKGEKLKSFTPSYSKVPIDSAMKKRVDDFFTNHLFKEVYLREKSQNLIFLPKFMPIFKDYRLAGNKIYIFSNFKKEDKYETFIYDFSGKLLQKTYLPLVESDTIMSVFPFDIHDNKIYQLVLDESNDQYKIQISNI